MTMNGEVWYVEFKNFDSELGLKRIERARITAKRATTEYRERSFDLITGRDCSAQHVQKRRAEMIAYRLDSDSAWTMIWTTKDQQRLVRREYGNG